MRRSLCQPPPLNCPRPRLRATGMRSLNSGNKAGRPGKVRSPSNPTQPRGDGPHSPRPIGHMQREGRGRRVAHPTPRGISHRAGRPSRPHGHPPRGLGGRSSDDTGESRAESDVFRLLGLPVRALWSGSIQPHTGWATDVGSIQPHEALASGQFSHTRL